MNPGDHPSAPRHRCHQNNLVLIAHLALSCSNQLLLSLDPGPEQAGAHHWLYGPVSLSGRGAEDEERVLVFAGQGPT